MPLKFRKGTPTCIMQQITIIGAGNLAWNLIPNLQNAGLKVHQLISRSKEKLDVFKEAYQIESVHTKLNNLNSETDIVFLTVSDRAISELAAEFAQLNLKKPLFLHTSGSIPLSALNPLSKNIGVFYPMQTFTQSKVSDFAEIPIFLEGNENVLKIIRPLAQKLSTQVYKLSSEDRLRLHMGAVWVNNFPNILYRIAQQLMPQTPELDFSIYHPLIHEHIEKVFAFQPQNTQTGPAIRADLPTINSHLNLLSDQAEYQQLYRQLSLLINPDLGV